MESRLRQVLASALMLVAILVRILLPGLHTHDECCGAAPRHVDTVACSCGHHHAPRHSSRSRSDVPRAADRALEECGEHHCLACDVELGNPCGCPGPSTDAPRCARAGDVPRDTATAALAVDRTGLPRTRAPPQHGPTYCA